MVSQSSAVYRPDSVWRPSLRHASSGRARRSGTVFARTASTVASAVSTGRA